jgi:hypothetical protein
LRFPYLMTVAHLSECGKEKLKKLARHSPKAGM